jgi:hypothetical protein
MVCLNASESQASFAPSPTLLNAATDESDFVSSWNETMIRRLIGSLLAAAVDETKAGIWDA